MSLNIKNPETVRLARKLAERTGETVTGALTTSVRERLERLERQSGRGVAERLMEIGRETAERWPDALSQADHADMLYDEDGLPR